MSVVSQRPHRQYTVLQWGQVDLQENANGSFVSNNSIFTILFFNTYYHKQINKILITAFNETFRQSLDSVYAHTPIRNVRELRTFNLKLRTSPEAKSMRSILTIFQNRRWHAKWFSRLQELRPVAYLAKLPKFSWNASEIQWRFSYACVNFLSKIGHWTQNAPAITVTS